MKLPAITHLQAAILGLLYLGEPVHAQSLQVLLRQKQISISSAAFYQAMGRIKQARLVKSKTAHDKSVGLRLTQYTITAKGASALDAAAHFYANILQLR